MENLLEFKAFLAEPKKIVIVTHHKPDADALGSSLGWAGYLKQYNHSVQVISPTDYPNFLNWMQGEKEVMRFSDSASEAEKATQLIADADLICCLDFNRFSRINEMGVLCEKSAAKKLLVDHHLDPAIDAYFNYWSDEAAATCQLIFDLIVELNDKEKITKGIAECLYAGIMTDTGSFRHPRTTSEVHQTIGELIDLGADSTRIHKLIYDNGAESRLRLLGHILLNKLVVLPEYATAYITLSAEELKGFKSGTGDTEGFVNYALSIEGIVLAAIIVDRTEAIKMSFRSAGNFNVNEFAQQHFEGGGHANAAGGKSDDNLEETVNKFVALLPKYQEALIAERDAFLNSK